MTPPFAVNISKIQGRSPEETKRRMKEQDWTRVDAVLYMVGHAGGVFAATLNAVFCSMSKYFHLTTLMLCFTFMVHNASKRYVFYMLQSSAGLIRKEIGVYKESRHSGGNDSPIYHLK